MALLQSNLKNSWMWDQEISLLSMVNPCFLKLFRIFLSRCGGSYMQKTFLPSWIKNGSSTVTPSIFSKRFLLFDPWSDTTTTTTNPICLSIVMHSKRSSFICVPDIGPLDKKYPSGCFHFSKSPFTMKTKAWLANSLSPGQNLQQYSDLYHNSAPP